MQIDTCANQTRYLILLNMLHKESTTKYLVQNYMVRVINTIVFYEQLLGYQYFNLLAYTKTRQLKKKKVKKKSEI